MAREKPADPLAWLEARGTVLLGDRAVKVLNDLYTEAAWLGACVARAQVGDVRKAATLQVDWEGWKPGDIDAARLLVADLDSNGLRELQERSGFVMRGINETRMTDLSNALSNAVGQGLSQSATASLIKEKVGGASRWANVVANTEARRAVTAATLDTYAAAGIEMKEWATAGNAVDECKEFEDDGPIPLDAMWGDVSGPPAHPNCLCVVVPVLGVAAPVTPSEVVTLPDDVEVVTEGESVPTAALPVTVVSKTSPAAKDTKYFLGDNAKRISEIQEMHGESATARTFDQTTYSYTYHNEDTVLKQILEDQKFTGFPDIVPVEQFENLKSSGDYTYLSRGVTGETQAQADGYAEAFKSGDLYAGRGMFGNGTYAGSTDAATEYFTTATAGGIEREAGAAIRMLLKTDARIIEKNDLYKLSQANEDLRREWRMANRQSEERDNPYLVLTDQGKLAAVHGYDAIRIPNPDVSGSGANTEIDYYVILNRTSVIVAGD